MQAFRQARIFPAIASTRSTQPLSSLAALEQAQRPKRAPLDESVRAEQMADPDDVHVKSLPPPPAPFTFTPPTPGALPSWSRDLSSSIASVVDSVTSNNGSTITTLSNGIRVVTAGTAPTQPTNWSASTGAAAISVALASGSRFEQVGVDVGVSKALERSAVGGSDVLSGSQLVADLESLGANVHTMTHRDQTVFNVDGPTSSFPHMAEIVSELVLRPSLTDETVGNAVQEMIAEAAMMEDPVTMADEGLTELVLTDALHAVAWGEKTGLGVRSLPTDPAEAFGAIKAETVRAWHKKHVAGPGIVIGVSGPVDHGTAVEVIARAFGDASSVAPPKVTDHASWIGGSEVLPGAAVPDSVMPSEAGDSGQPIGGEMTRVMIGFPSPPLTDVKGLFTCFALQRLLGGGTFFSSGGPGKGMHSRLQHGVLNRHHWMRQASAFGHAYSDGGIFGVYFVGPADPRASGVLLDLVVASLASLVGPMSEVEGARARNSALGNILMNTETRITAAEDLALQTLRFGTPYNSTEMSEIMESLTNDDLRALAEQMLNAGPPALVVRTSEQLVEHFPQNTTLLEHIQERIKWDQEPRGVAGKFVRTDNQ